MQQSDSMLANRLLRACLRFLLCSALNSASGTTAWERGAGDEGCDLEGDGQSSMRTGCGRATATGEEGAIRLQAQGGMRWEWSVE